MFDLENKITEVKYNKHPAGAYLGFRLFIASNPRAVTDKKLSENAINAIRSQSPYTSTTKYLHSSNDRHRWRQHVGQASSEYNWIVVPAKAVQHDV